jgi:hypothetical protein
MKKIMVVSQKQFDKLPYKFKEYTNVVLNADILRIGKTPSNCIFTVSGGTIQYVEGGTIQSVEGGTIQRVSGGTIQYVEGGTIQSVSGGTIQSVSDGTIQRVSGGTIQSVSDGTIQRVSGGTIQRVSGGTIQRVSGGTIQSVSGGTIQYIWGNSTINIFSNTDIQKAMLPAVLIFRNGFRQKISGNATKVYQKKESYTKQNFVDLFKKGKLILYKSVNPETECDFFTGKIKYETGKTVGCPDWDSNANRQCGGGLHLSPTPAMALSYNQGKIKVCEVKIKNFVVYSKDITKVRCKEVTVIGDLK